MSSFDSDETTTVGLVWGLLDGGQAEQAHALAQATRLVWPDSADLAILQALCASVAGLLDAGPTELSEDDPGHVQAGLDSALADRLAADPRWSTLLATLHQRERLQQERPTAQGRRSGPVKALGSTAPSGALSTAAPTGR